MIQTYEIWYDMICCFLYNKHFCHVYCFFDESELYFKIFVTVSRCYAFDDYWSWYFSYTREGQKVHAINFFLFARVNLYEGGGVYTLVQWNVIIYANVTLPLTLVSNKLDVPFFSTLFQWENKIVTASKCLLEETVPKLSVNVKNRKNHKNQYPSPVLNFGFT